MNLLSTLCTLCNFTFKTWCSVFFTWLTPTTALLECQQPTPSLGNQSFFIRHYCHLYPDFSNTRSFLRSTFQLAFVSLQTRFPPCVQGTTLIISLKISPCNIAKPKKDHLRQNKCPGTGVREGDSWQTSQQPRGVGVGWRTGLTPVRWWSGSQVKKHLVWWWEGGCACAHEFKSDTRLTAWVLLPSLMNS